ncbi:fibronectin type 3 and ankyrin repeat domains protein [Penicillium malachiteum]|uniref:fibronectin type 3 and ankyrin repeat domains protein n=1 Tax=Penicillium malachiteum TaxID=1324776 RepID=UPI0025480543|nr:fibronectin type 3 and ankyrin repeat domains protein [Penicillium malachiteum]KAJ5715056.1 fibronectin type 3 and ankyrin repeat domains protein [Penicillium malachiteum]
MDPLSIASGVIAVLQAASTTSQGLQKLWELRRALEDFLILTNEVSELRVVLCVLETSLKSLSADTQDQTVQEILHSLTKSWDDAVKVLSDIDSLVRDKLHKNHNTWDQERQNEQPYEPFASSSASPISSLSRPKLSKRGWLFHRSKILKLQRRLRDIINVLNICTAALANLQSTSAKGKSERNQVFITNHVIQNISTTVPSARDIAQRNDASDPRSISDQLSLVIEKAGREIQQEEPLSSSSSSPLTLQSSQESERLNFKDENAPSNDSSLFCITTSLAIEKCEPFCSCQCHIRTSIQSPSWARSILGSFVLHTNSNILVDRRPCNYRRCKRNGEASTRFTFYAPSWLLRRAVSVTASKGAGLDPASFSMFLKVPHVLPANAEILKAIEYADTEKIKAMLLNRMISPHDIDESGLSLLSHPIGRSWDHHAASLFIQAGADRFYRDRYGFPAIYRGLCAFLQRQRLASTLPEELHDLRILFADEDSLEQFEFTPLHRAVLGLSPFGVSTALAINPLDVDTSDTCGRVPIMWAAWLGDVVSIEALITAGADVDKPDGLGRTALLEAVWAGEIECVRLLLRAGASASTATKEGDAPIHIASYADTCGVEMISLLLEYGADVSMRDAAGQTPLHRVGAGGSGTGGVGTDKKAEILVQHGANVNARDLSGKSPLHSALVSANTSVARGLLARGAEIDDSTRDSNACSTLQIICWYFCVEVGEMLIEAAKEALMVEVDLAVEHEGHDLEHCFRSCRAYTGRVLHLEEEESVFMRLIDAITESQA